MSPEPTPRRPRAYSERKYEITMTVSGIRVSKDVTGRARCDFWGRQTIKGGASRNLPCVVIGPNFERVKSVLVEGAEIKAWGVFETAKPAAGMAKPFHLIRAFTAASANHQAPAREAIAENLALAI